MVLGIHSCKKETEKGKLISNYVGLGRKTGFESLKKSILIDLLA
ncbi:hypothetical protein LEP1GSC193_1921 [Leptospira alstonii serovar Pingchang str. 80-412]|uniref:Uncharacterized protein n=2 Tax=Leptospira alstonii TaxID=28452 RepID=M6DAS7_9LEPT|nr:hypothetical protein LEP1GSC194_0893 [Leptospira alstonii serovar Sichuan str. 79601]EQA81354.1 hypothetical protein LEP1GSC193_1921 [Leptospira alstonii serovar Pingchang str. 80-412]